MNPDDRRKFNVRGRFYVAEPGWPLSNSHNFRYSALFAVCVEHVLFQALLARGRQADVLASASRLPQA
jgi:hypothetical protein